jgi:hypothetical protein
LDGVPQGETGDDLRGYLGAAEDELAAGAGEGNAAIDGNARVKVQRAAIDVGGTCGRAVEQ